MTGSDSVRVRLTDVFPSRLQGPLIAGRNRYVDQKAWLVRTEECTQGSES